MAHKEEKHRHMKIRRDIGDRLVKSVSQSLLHSSYPYLCAHACFKCQKSFKMNYAKARICPECSETIYLMGRAFKTPKQSDRQQWKKVQKLYALGFRFHCYDKDYRPLPQRLQDVDRFVEQHPDHKLRIAEIERSLLPSKN